MEGTEAIRTGMSVSKSEKNGYSRSCFMREKGKLSSTFHFSELDGMEEIGHPKEHRISIPITLLLLEERPQETDGH